MVTRHRKLLNQPFLDLVCSRGLKRARVLDLGCGPGWIPVELARRNPGWEVVGLDSSKTMLEFGRKSARESGLEKRVNFQQGNAGDLSGMRGEFDLVLSSFVLHHFDVPEMLLNEAASALKPGGKVMIHDLLRPPAWQIPVLLQFCRWVLRYDVGQEALYRESLHAALTRDEIRRAVANSRLAGASVRSFRVLNAVIEK
jgi:ubiquinone/menaquinone biosynthesis C-methylase UbiE